MVDPLLNNPHSVSLTLVLFPDGMLRIAFSRFPANGLFCQPFSSNSGCINIMLSNSCNEPRPFVSTTPQVDVKHNEQVLSPKVFIPLECDMVSRRYNKHFAKTVVAEGVFYNSSLSELLSLYIKCLFIADPPVDSVLPPFGRHP